MVHYFACFLLFLFIATFSLGHSNYTLGEVDQLYALNENESDKDTSQNGIRARPTHSMLRPRALYWNGVHDGDQYEDTLRSGDTERYGLSVRHAKAEPSAEPTLVPLTQPGPSSKYAVSCPPNVPQGCRDIRDGPPNKGSCDTKGQYRVQLFPGSSGPSISDCRECSCSDTTRENHVGPSGGSNGKNGATSNKMEIDGQERLKQIGKKRKILRRRHTEVEPYAGPANRVPFASLGQSQNFVVGCPLYVPEECHDVHHGLPHEGWCDKEGRYRYGQQGIPRLQCHNCRCFETMIRPSSRIAGKAVPGIGNEKMKEVAGKQKRTSRNLVPRHAIAETMQTTMPDARPGTPLPLIFPGRSTKYIAHCPQAVPVKCRDVSNRPSGAAYCTNSGVYKIAGGAISLEDCRGCLCIPRLRSGQAIAKEKTTGGIAKEEAEGTSGWAGSERAQDTEDEKRREAKKLKYKRAKEKKKERKRARAEAEAERQRQQRTCKDERRGS